MSESIKSNPEPRTPENSEDPGPKYRTLKDQWKAETRPLLDEIRRLVRFSDISQRDVEKGAGFSKGYLSQLLGQNLDLKMWHILAILKVLDVDSGHYFQRVFGPPPETSSKPRSLEKFERLSQPISEDLDRQLGELYRDRADTLDSLRHRLGKCEDALSQLADQGLLRFEPRDLRAQDGE